MIVNGRIEFACGCGQPIYRVVRANLPDIGTVVACQVHGETTVARTTYVSV